MRRDGLLTEIPLPPLSAEETAELATQVAKDAFTANQHEQLFQTTEGNPLFVVEMVRAGLGHDANGKPPAALPPKVYAVIQSRLAQLSPQSKDVVSLAAVIGRSFSYKVLAAASAVGVNDLMDCLDELWQRNIIRKQGEESYDFQFALGPFLFRCAAFQYGRQSAHKCI